MVVKRLSVAALMLLILALLALPKVRPLVSSSSGPESGESEERLLEVEAVVLEPEELDYKIFTSGTIRANEAIDLRAEVPGKVVDILFREGSRVRAGDLLLKINDNELQAEKRRTEFQLSLAELREERQSRLLERGGISQQEYDATLNEVNVLRAGIELIDARIEKTEIRAPFDGNVGLKYVSEGSFISSESRIATLNDIDPVKIDFSIPERYFTAVDPGDELFFRVQGVDSTFIGHVYAIEPRIDPQTRTLQIRAESSNPEGLLLPGAFANIELILERERAALMVPTISVIPAFERQLVYLYRSGEAHEIEVVTGDRTDTAVRILDGAAPGDTVLTTGLLQLRPGVPVRVTSVSSSADR